MSSRRSPGWNTPRSIRRSYSNRVQRRTRAGGVLVVPIVSVNVLSRRPIVNVKELIRAAGVCIYNHGERITEIVDERR